MKSVIVSCCKHREQELEFVRPLIYLFPNSDIVKYDQKLNFDKYEIIILSGTGLKDFDYLNYIENFYQLKEKNQLIIGICAGAQILSRIYKLKTEKIEIIGKKQLNNGEYAFFLTNEIIKKTPISFENIYFKEYIAYTKYKNTHIFSYHPEVLNSNQLLKIKKDFQTKITKSTKIK